MSAENAELIERARAFLSRPDDIDDDPEAFIVIGQLADALERAETLLAQVRRSADEWWSLYDGELKKSEAAASDQMRRDADLIEGLYLGPDSGRSYDGSEPPDAHCRNAYDEGIRAAADRLRTLADGQGRG